MRFKIALLVLLLVPIFAAPLAHATTNTSSYSSSDTELLKQLIALVTDLQRQLAELLDQQSSDDSSDEIRLTYPNGGASYVEGDSLRVKWTPKLPGVSLIELIPEKASGKSIVLNSYPVTPNTSGIFERDATFPLGGYTGKYRIRITTPDGESDMSDRYFTIRSKTDPFDGPLTVDYPNGGQVFSEGTEVGITWHPNGPLTSTDIKKVELISTQGGANYGLCSDLKEECDDDDGIIYLRMPRTTGLEPRFKIKITGEDGQTDMSDRSFIVNAKG